MTKTKQYILIAGNPGDGFGFYGPFEDPDCPEVQRLVETEFDDISWWISELAPLPEERECGHCGRDLTGYPENELGEVRCPGCELVHKFG